MKKKILVLGYGVSGKASAALLKSRGFSVVVADKNPGENVVPDAADFPLDEIAQVVVSPGIPSSHPIVQTAMARSIEVLGETEMAFRFLENRCVGVTGTNGKTTVTMLVEHVLNAAGIRARAVGNIGTALSDYLLSPDAKEVLVVELSSFQLETLQAKKLQASVYLNLTPDHLNRYSSLRAYAAAKARIQDCSDKLFVSKQVVADYGDLLKPGFQIFESEEESVAPISWLEYIQLGVPERQNVQAAAALCAAFGVGKEQFLKALKQFKKPPHRIEWVGAVRGVHYINDSKGTNVDAVLHAIALFKGPVILIAGGVDKGASYQPWIQKFQGIVKKIIAYGQAASKMEVELAPFFPFQRVEKFESAFDTASHEAIAGDCVLLSPACSSFDQFRDYEHRGDEFRNKFKSLQN
ncbi:MAG TPA: UDP-N-acetylmuramoyl-L-alanine--D-glutamate ligase [Chlamydiales bacterium]|jgi:UDP-N-acetylmuramoylalanine--D-glutamate ligase|nr:UDP-N-acetylmuramoyl-L-alanine--D-glutamate ligase [Chlamydiales bacterium]